MREWYFTWYWCPMAKNLADVGSYVKLITLRAKLSGAVYCNQSWLFVCFCGFVGLLPR